MDCFQQTRLRYPDFKFNELTIDKEKQLLILGWGQTPKWDIYVMGHLPESQEHLELWLANQRKNPRTVDKAEALVARLMVARKLFATLVNLPENRLDF